MLNLTTISRPYAKALLYLARDAGDYDSWLQSMQFLSAVVNDQRVKLLLSNLAIPHEVKAELLCDIGAQALNEQAKNLVKILATNKRLLLIPEICRVYDDLRKVDQHKISLKLISAQQVDATTIEEMQALWTKDFGEQVILEQEFDPELIAGAKLKIGDRVLNSSIQDRLRTLYKHLTA